MKTGRPRKTYALYKGDEIIAEGTVNEIAEELNSKPKSILFYNTPSYKNRCKVRERKYEKTYFLVEVVDEDWTDKNFIESDI